MADTLGNSSLVGFSRTHLCFVKVSSCCAHNFSGSVHLADFAKDGGRICPYPSPLPALTHLNGHKTGGSACCSAAESLSALGKQYQVGTPQTAPVLNFPFPAKLSPKGSPISHSSTQHWSVPLSPAVIEVLQTSTCCWISGSLSQCSFRGAGAAGQL